MKKIFVIILILVLVSLGWFIFSSFGDDPQPSGGGTRLDTLVPGPGTSGGVSDQLETLLIQVEGQTLEINNIIALPHTRSMGPQRYELRKSAEEDFFPSFNVVFADASDSFSISLNKEPISETRKEVEEFMLRTLGITESDMCKLKVFIGVPIHVNQYFSGNNLGFSFCPNSVAL